MLLRSLQVSANDFISQQILQSICKSHSSFSSSVSQRQQIDYLALQQKISQLQQIQQKTCQQIVQFVDQHCGQYIKINQYFQQLQQQIINVEDIVKQINYKLKDYAKIYYKNQNKIQQVINKYQTQILEKILLTKCKEQTMFLEEFVKFFDNIMSKIFENLSFKERSLILRFCYKFKYLQSLFNHNLLHQNLPQYLKIYQIITNISYQVEFYLSEQLSRLVKFANNNKNTHNNSQTINNKSNKNIKQISLNQIKLCYTYLNKLSDYYKNIQQNLLGRQLQSVQKNLINNKTNLIVGKNIQVCQEYFKCLFTIISQFPGSYPSERIVELIFSQLKKPQLKFLYTYTFAIFPVSFNYYLQQTSLLREPYNLIFKSTHNWDLKRWIDVRQTNIIDRSQKDWQKGGDLIKWVDIIFKDNCKIQGVKTDFVKLIIKVINKYLKFIELKEFSQQNVNKYVEIYNWVEKAVKEKIVYYFVKEQQQKQKQLQQINKLATSISLSLKNTFKKSLNNIILSNLKLIINSCLGCFQQYKSFIMKTIKSSSSTQINTYSSLFKPLLFYLQNNTQKLSSQSKQYIKQIIINEIQKYYDQVYVNQIYQYGKSNLSKEQFAQVMEVVGKERAGLFEVGKDVV